MYSARKKANILVEHQFSNSGQNPGGHFPLSRSMLRFWPVPSFWRDQSWPCNRSVAKGTRYPLLFYFESSPHVYTWCRLFLPEASAAARPFPVNEEKVNWNLETQLLEKLDGLEIQPRSSVTWSTSHRLSLISCRCPVAAQPCQQRPNRWRFCSAPPEQGGATPQWQSAEPTDASTNQWLKAESICRNQVYLEKRSHRKTRRGWLAFTV